MPRGKQRSVEPSRFSMVPRNDVPRSAFDNTHTHKTTFDAGLLILVLVLEILPGDSVRLNMTALARLATPIVPIMDNLHLESFFFFCPNRLVWDNWQAFMGEQGDPTDQTSYLVPYVPVEPAPANPVGSLSDYFGITHAIAGAGGAIRVNALPFRMNNLIWNEFFRDQDLQSLASVPKGDGPDDMITNNYAVRNRGKRHDYFTSARPWPEKPLYSPAPGSAGGPYPSNAMYGPFVPGGAYSHFTTVPYHVGAPVTGLGVVSPNVPTTGPLTTVNTGNRTYDYGRYYSSDIDTLVMRAQPAGDYPDVRVLINDIRTANMMQIMSERNARGGTRYTEIIRSHFGVTSPDARLQRPEFLGGGHSMVHVNPVAQTSFEGGSVGEETVLGEQAGIATAIADRHGFAQSFTEHGYIIGYVTLRADITYQQGLNRMWFRRGRYDFYWPGLAHLGEQAVYLKEIFSQGAVADDNVFGYQERWAEYRNIPNRISGGFRSTNATPLDMWHLAQEFASAPALNAAFIVEDPPMERVLQVDTQAGFEVLFDSVFDVRMVRPLPMFSIPGMGPRL